MMLTKLKVAAGVLLVLAALGLGAGLYTQRVLAEKPGAEEAPFLIRGSDGVWLPPGMRAKLGVQTGEVKPRAAVMPRVLHLSGSLALDPTRLWRIRARFAPAEVVQIGQTVDAEKTASTGRTTFRELRAGDHVKKGQVLAICVSVDVGSKKNDLFDALVQLTLDEIILDRAEKAYQTGAIPEVFLLTARRNVQANRSAVNRAENSLKIWGISAREIDAVRQEAREAGDPKRKPQTEEARKARARRWARVEVLAPEDGILVERNVNLHEVLVDGTITLFVIAKVDRLMVLAQAKEDDLPALMALKPEQRRWTIRPQGRYGPDNVRAQGRIIQVGYLIDPKQHTAVVTGYVDNRFGRLRAGQFITASITLPPAAKEMVLPAAAVVEDGRRAFVFIQPDAMKFFYEQRRVLIVRRGHDRVHVRSELTPEQERQGFKAVRLGERIVTSGALELKAILDDLKAGEDR
jgi:cobalt-zinc-cadmium efflux system membrane fusion protein